MKLLCALARDQLRLQRPLKHAARVLVAVALLSACAPVAWAHESAAKRVLVLSTGSRLGPGFLIVDRQIQAALATVQSPRAEIYAENLDIIQFPSEDSARMFGDYLAAKYQPRPPDLVILVYVGNLGATTQIVERAFAGTPVVVAGFTEEEVRREQFGSLVSGVVQRIDPTASFELMLRLHPDLRRIVVIAGSADVDRDVFRRVERASEAYRERVKIEFWTDRPMTELRRMVGALPPHTAVLYTRHFRDATGQLYVSSEVGQWIAEVANVPVYLTNEGSLGTGAVGGAMASIEAFGARAGELARRIVTGEAPQSLPFAIQADTVPMFDWRALQRWGIDESRLPARSVVRFKPPSLWEQYRLYIVAALLLLAAQSATIVALAVQRQRAHRAQAALDDSRQLTELATSAAELGLWSRELDGRSFWANTPLRAMLGLGKHEALRFGEVFSRVHPEDRARVVAEVESADAAGLPFEAEFRTRLPDGTERWLLAKGRSLAATMSRGSRRMGVMLDITERKRAEESLSQQQAFLREVIDVNPNFIFAKDREGRFTLANKAIADVYGVQVDDLIGRTDADFNTNAQEVAFFRTVDLEVMNTLQERFIAEERVTDAHGEVRWVQTVKRPIMGSGGVANQVLGASTDITQRKRAEVELQQQRATLAHFARVAVVGELAASLAHELNQPLAAIVGNARAGELMMARQPVDLEELRAALGDIVEAGQRAAEVIRRTRALVKKEADSEFTQLDLAHVIGDVAKLVRNDAMLHEVRMALETPAGRLLVQGDRIQLQQVVLNIVLNAFDALKASPPGSRTVTLRAERAGNGMFRVAVRDCGPGLEEAQIERIFDAFYTTKDDGLGMGLPICRSIVESHGGRLWAENNPDGGATFYFTIPAQEAAPPTDEHPRS